MLIVPAPDLVDWLDSWNNKFEWDLANLSRNPLDLSRG